MPALKLLLALASVAIVALSSAPVHVNALVADRAQVARHVRGHDSVAERRHSGSSFPGACKPRPSSSLPPSSPPAPASTTPPLPSSTASSSNGKQWGLAWDVDPAYLSNFALPNVGYLYSWRPFLPSPLPDGIEGIPMLWGSNRIEEFQKFVVKGYASTVLGMNEPNKPGQSNLTAQEGFDMWMQYIVPLKAQGYYLISPACTDDPAGLLWYEEFFRLCKDASNCLVDAIAFHAYTTNASDLILYAKTLHDTYNMDVWITEFADQNYSGTGDQASTDEVWAFAREVVNFVESTPWCKAFPFGVVGDLQGVNPDNTLLTDGHPTSLACYYFGGADCGAM